MGAWIMKIGGFAIVLLAGALAAAPAEAKRASRQPQAYAQPAAPAYAAPAYAVPAAPARPAPVWGADGYRFDPPGAGSAFAPSPFGY